VLANAKAQRKHKKVRKSSPAMLCIACLPVPGRKRAGQFTA